MKSLGIPKQVMLYQRATGDGGGGLADSTKESMVVINGDVAAYHTAVVSDRGHVFMWGFGDQLPRKVFFETESILNKRQTLNSQRWYKTQSRRTPLYIVQVSCANEHSAALSNAGEVFTWGDANPIVLGHQKYSKSKVNHNFATNHSQNNTFRQNS